MVNLVSFGCQTRVSLEYSNDFEAISILVEVAPTSIAATVFR